RRATPSRPRCSHASTACGRASNPARAERSRSSSTASSRCRLLPMFPPVTLPRSSQRVIRHAGADYQLQVAWPASPPPPGGYPVVYLLDAHAGFATAAESERARSHRTDATGVPPTVVVGISLG